MQTRVKKLHKWIVSVSTILSSFPKCICIEPDAHGKSGKEKKNSQQQQTGTRIASIRMCFAGHSFTTAFLRGSKASMLSHTYPYSIWGRLGDHQHSAITRLTDNFKCDLMSDLVICKHRKEYGHTQHWMSLLTPDVIKQQKTQKLSQTLW